MRLRARLAPVLVALLAAPAAPAAVFINEIHYDDATASGDVGERIEVVATAGESLSGYRVQLYNGSTPSAAVVYDDDPVPVGSLVTCGAQVRVAVVAYPSNGIQNGPSDGIALVNASGQLVQFLSYEGAITGSGGAASGRGSQNLPVAESGTTAAGTSLQLGGSGSVYANFGWNASATQTFGTCNRGQSFAAPNPPPQVTSTTPAHGAGNVPGAADLSVGFSEPVTAAPGAFSLQCSLSGAVALSHAASGTTFALAKTTVLRGGESCTLTVHASGIADAGGARPVANTAASFTVANATAGYWSKVNTSSASQLRCSLHATIRDHTVYPYSGGTTNTWTVLEIADEDPASANRILDVYRNRSYLKGSERAGTGTGLTYNREHTWPNSLGFGSATGDLGLPHAPYTDLHMLYLSDATYNADRGNKPYADCTVAGGCGERATESNAGAGGGTGLYPGNSNWVKGPDGNAGSFQAWGRRKGDLARAVLYMAIRYEGGKDARGQSEPDLEMTDDRAKIVITSASPAYMGLLSTLLAWHQADPPDALERNRHEVVAQFQGNRNPFVDHPEWASAALFNSTRPASCQLN